MNILLYMDYMYGLAALILTITWIGGTNMSKKVSRAARQLLAEAAADYQSAQAQRYRDSLDAKARREEATRRNNTTQIARDEAIMDVIQNSTPLDAGA